MEPPDPRHLVLRDFVMTYANIERRDHDALEVALFQVWLRAVGALGLKPSPTITRVGTPIPKET